MGLKNNLINKSRNSTQAVKNSTWQLSTNIFAKMGSLIFSIILAKMLGAEVYGLYGLALSTILIFAAFSDLGLGSTLTTFLAKTMDKSPRKAKAYIKYLTEIKLLLLSLTSLILVLLSSWVANNYYNKPIFFALIAGAIYLPCSGIMSWLTNFFVAKNKLKNIFLKECVVQFFRITFVPILIIFFMSKLSTEFLLFWMFILISFSYFASIVFLLLKIKKEKIITSERSDILTGEEKKDIFRFILPLSITALSGPFFGYIDILMLGRFVSSSFISYYQVAFNLISAAMVILSFMGGALLPIFARYKEEDSIKLFRKSRLILLGISVLAMVFTILVSKYLILFVYGEEYVLSIFYLRIFSVLLLTGPMIDLYSNYYTAKKETKVIAFSLVVSTILNVVLNFFFIKIGLTYGTNEAVLGACIATIVSRFAYLGILGVGRKLGNIINFKK